MGFNSGFKGLMPFWSLRSITLTLANYIIRMEIFLIYALIYAHFLRNTTRVQNKSLVYIKFQEWSKLFSWPPAAKVTYFGSENLGNTSAKLTSTGILFQVPQHTLSKQRYCHYGTRSLLGYDTVQMVTIHCSCVYCRRSAAHTNFRNLLKWCQFRSRLNNRRHVGVTDW